MIVENLIQSTKNAELEWINKGSVDKRSYHREYYAIAEDGTNTRQKLSTH